MRAEQKRGNAVKAVFGPEGYNLSQEQAETIAKACNAQYNYSVALCSDPDETKREKLRKRAERATNRAEIVMNEAGFTGNIFWNQDPRGFPLKVNFPSGIYNSWGGHEDGWGFGDWCIW